MDRYSKDVNRLDFSDATDFTERLVRDGAAKALTKLEHAISPSAVFR